jgi:primosomal replication protein N''
MVCQKQAATGVVLEKLRAAGLEGLCLEVHDAADDRQEVFRKIRDQVESLKGRHPAGDGTRAEISRQITEKEALLDQHARAFHEQHPQFGLSYRQMRAWEGQLLKKFPTVRELLSLHKPLEKLSLQQIRELCPSVGKVGQLFRLADPLHNPWRHRQPTVTAHPTIRTDVQAALEELKALDAQHVEHVQRHGAGGVLPVDVGDFTAVASDLTDRLRLLEKSNSLFLTTRALFRAISSFDKEALHRKEQQCQRGIELAEQVVRTSLDPVWTPICADRHEAELKRLRDHAQRVMADAERKWAFLSLRSWWARRAIEQLRLPAFQDARSKVAASLLAQLDAKLARDELVSINRALVPSIQVRGDEARQVKFPHMAQEALQIACWLGQNTAAHGWMSPLIDEVFEDPTQIGPLLDVLECNRLRAPIVLKFLGALKGMEGFLTPQAVGEPRASILAGKSIRDWVNTLITGLDKLEPLIALEADRRHRQGPGGAILEALEEYESRVAAREKLPVPHVSLVAEQYADWWTALVEYTAIQMWERECQWQHPVLLQVTPEVHEKTREELKHLLERKRQLEAGTICNRWLEHQLQYRDRPWAKIFQLRSSRQNQALRLREAVEASLSHGLLAMRPCWLVDPEAVAQIFPLKSGCFDVVIFDEASQCPLEQAVPAIYRGKCLVVTGDEKQLPPTGFFSARPGGEPDEQDTEEQEASSEPVVTEERPLRRLGAQFLLLVEDLLEAAIASLQPRWLQVHYRSEHPDLIEFSNRAFYKGQLEAPPCPVSSQCDQRPIVYHDVGGLYSRETNQQEARKVIQLLREIWLPEGLVPTVGVVTFNRPQRELIEDLLQEECQRDEAFAIRCDQERGRKENNQDVGFFVKNLENVQGDERDVMIFSTTFGRDSTGRFFRRFGPVGTKGGERRLNVAITRAKKRVIVVSSMPIEDISDALQAGRAPGASMTPSGYLQLYLAYAKAVSEGNVDRRNYVLDLLKHQAAPGRPEGGPESPFEEEVREVLEKCGHTVHSQIGESGFRIDLGVQHPDPKLGYILGIECDGATYHSGRSARIRDVWREKILRKRGWLLHRIWSTKWWFDRDGELEKLDHALSEAATKQSASAAKQPAGQGDNASTADPVGPPPAAAEAVGRQPSEASGQPPENGTPVVDEDKTLETLYRESKLSWDKLLAKYGLTKPIDRKMTLREARSRAGKEPCKKNGQGVATLSTSSVPHPDVLPPESLHRLA